MIAPRQNRSCPTHARCVVHVDFDGTIAPEDPTDALLDRFAGGRWREIEREGEEGGLAARTCMARQVALLRASPRDLDGFVRTVRIDPGFPAFVRFCRAAGMKVQVISDGLDLLVGGVLRAAGLDLPFRANRLRHIGNGRWTLDFPFLRPACWAALGNCKCGHASSAAAGIAVLVGDGPSDFCLAGRCDLVLAKSGLADYCRRNRLPHVAIDNFAAARIALAGWIVNHAGGRATSTAAALPAP